MTAGGVLRALVSIAGVVVLAACGAAGESASGAALPVADASPSGTASISITSPVAAAPATVAAPPTPATTPALTRSSTTAHAIATQPPAPRPTSAVTSPPPPPQPTALPTNPPAPPPCGVTITATDYQFSPSSPTIAHGCALTMTDGGGYHTFTGSTFDSGQMSPGQSYVYVFQTPGAYAYHCQNHAIMTGTIHVT